MEKRGMDGRGTDERSTSRTDEKQKEGKVRKVDGNRRERWENKAFIHTI